jgi:hypothetical protein
MASSTRKDGKPIGFQRFVNADNISGIIRRKILLTLFIFGQ